MMVTAAACVLTKHGAKKPPFCTRTTSFRWAQLHVGSVQLDVLEALKLRKSSAKPSWPPSTTFRPNCISFCAPILSEWQQQLSCPGQKAGGSLAHLPPRLTTPLHSYPISYLILSVLSSPYRSNLLSVSSTHWELGLLPPNRYPALLSDFKLSSTFNHASIHSFNKYWGPSYKHLAKCLKCRMEKTELMPAHQELTVYGSREDDPKVIYMSTIYGYTYEYILYSMVINFHYLASYKYQLNLIVICILTLFTTSFVLQLFIFVVWFHPYEILEHAKLVNQYQKSACLEGYGGNLLERGTKKLSGIMEMFCILFQLYLSVKTHLMKHLRFCILFMLIIPLL